MAVPPTCPDMGTMVTMSENRRAEGQLDESPWDKASGAFTAWRAGDATAVDDLVATMTPVLWHVVRAYGHDREAAGDVIQATWLGFVRLHQTIQDPQAVASWLITSARRGAATQARTARRADPVDDEVLAAVLPDDVSAETVALLDDEAARLWRAVATVDERCRKLLRVIAFMDRPDYQSLSQDLDMPVGSIGPTRARCLDKVRTALKEGGER
jgi:RNA polymerase sigma factor (sigma-70 family)